MTNKTKSNICTLNLLLGLFGYALLVSMCSGFLTKETTQIVTVPFRFFCLVLSIITIVICRKERVKLDDGVWCLIIYWFIITYRFITDAFFYYRIYGPNLIRAEQLIFGIALPLFISTIRSIHHIDFKKLYRWSFWMILISCLSAYFLNQEVFEVDDQRVEIVGLNPISLGYQGGLLIVLSLFFKTKLKFLTVLIKIGCIVFGAFIVAKAGSRGPLIVSLGLILIYFMANMRRMMLIIPILFLFGIAGWNIFGNSINTFLMDEAPTLYNRMDSTIENHDTSNRDLNYIAAWHVFEEHPIFGNQLGLYVNGNIRYTHNLFLDALIAGGILGFLIFTFAYIKAFRNGLRLLKTPCSPIALIAYKYMLEGLFSGCFYLASPTGALMAVLLLSRQTKQQKSLLD